MAIALTAERLGHRRLIVSGTALCVAASVLGGFAGTVEALLVARVIEGLGFIAVAVAIPPLLLRIASATDQRAVMTLWTTYMPAGAGSMMLVIALFLAGASWRVDWWVAGSASAAVLIALLLFATGRRELDQGTATHASIVGDMRDVATSGGPLAIAFCFGVYSCCWFAVVGFLPTLMVERLAFSPSTAAIVTAVVTMVNVLGNLGGGLLLQRGVPRVALIVGAAVPMAVCTAGLFLDGLPDILRLVLAGLYSMIIGVVPAALFTAVPVHAARPQLVGAGTGLLMQGSNFGALLGPPVTAALVSSGGWPAAAWLTSVAMAAVAVSGVFLHWREGRTLRS